MQTATGRAAKDSSKGGPGSSRFRRRFRGRALDPLTIIIAGFLALISVGLMAAVFIGYQSGVWPPKGNAESQNIVLTPTVLQASGLELETVGQPRREGDAVTVSFKVTNKVHMAAPMKGTPSPNAATPAPGPVDLYNATIKVLFTRTEGGKKIIVGSGVGNVTDLAYGQTKQIDIVAVPVGDFTEYEAFPDTVTNKATIKTESEAGSTPEGTASPASPTP